MWGKVESRQKVFIAPPLVTPTDHAEALGCHRAQIKLSEFKVVLKEEPC